MIEHPAESRAWDFFGLPIPKKGAGWSDPDQYGGRSCYVEQWHYGHPARKATYLYAIGIDFDAFELVWDRTRAVIPQWMIDKYGESKARKIGVVAMMGGKDKQAKRNRTPIPFRDVLIAMARSVNHSTIEAVHALQEPAQACAERRPAKEVHDPAGQGCAGDVLRLVLRGGQAARHEPEPD